MWLLILRGISIELRSHVDTPLWQSFWDAVFAIASTLLAIFFGAALGNVVRGVPLHPDGYFFLPLWTNFRPVAEAGILDWYTVLIGIASLLTLAMHGGWWLAYKTEGAVRERAKRAAVMAWWGVAIFTVFITIASFRLQPHLWENFSKYPWGYIFPALAVAGLSGIRVWAGDESGLRPFLSSTAYIVGMLTSVVFGVYPYVLPANNDPSLSLTIQKAAAPPYGLIVGLRWWILGIVLATGYFFFIFRYTAGKVQVDETH